MDSFNSADGWGWIFLFVIFIIVFVIVLLWLNNGIQTNPNNYASWISIPGPCIDGQQAVEFICTDPVQGCLAPDRSVQINSYIEHQSCRSGSARARWQITQTDTQTRWVCAATGTQGPNLCRLFEQGNEINSSSIESVPQPVGTIITIDSPHIPSLAEQNIPAVDQQIVWSSQCIPFPDQPNPQLPLAEGTIGERPAKLNWSNFRNGVYPLSELFAHSTQLCRRFPSAVNLAANTEFASWINVPVIIALTGPNNYEWINADRHMLFVQRVIHANKIKVLILNLDRQTWFTPARQNWPLVISYPPQKGEYTSQDIVKFKGGWTLEKISTPRREFLTNAPRTVIRYVDVQCPDQSIHLRLAQCVDS